MSRSPMNVAALVLLAVAGLLTLADYENVPRDPWTIDAGRSMVFVQWGVLNVHRFASRAFVSVPLGQLAIALAMVALILSLAGVWRDRRRQWRGFPVDPVTTQPSGSK